MTAIQRWYIDLDYDTTPRSVTMEDAIKAAELDPTQSDVWCRARDVAELERITATYLKLLSDKREENQNLLARNRVLALSEHELKSEVESLKASQNSPCSGCGQG